SDSWVAEPRTIMSSRQPGERAASQRVQLRFDLRDAQFQSHARQRHARSCRIDSAQLGLEPSAVEIQPDHERFDLPARIRRPKGLELRAYLVGVEDKPRKVPGRPQLVTHVVIA